jgi:CheY-like chemotaxis protein/anti-sigma regulatory factor (Ser/Thr protein kinase)
VAAHELRTPLTPLSMYLQNIERRLQRQQPIDPELAAKARRQVARLARLVEDLLDVSRLESKRVDLARERIVIDELVDEVVGDFRGASRQHQIVFHRPQTRALIEGDRARLEQVLVNLLTNAIKYSPQGGQISLRVEKRGGEVSVSVTDRGIGISPEEHEHLFKRFFRARTAAARSYGGLGIGLYVSNEIVQRHGGRFEVESEPGVGSTFTFFLPLAHGQEMESNGKARVLLVDDDPEILEATGQVLREWGYAVDEARDGQTALALARGSKPDLMLVDLMMPVMDGWTLIARMREEKIAAGVPLVVFSADRDAREKARSLQADAALRKPFELEELQEVVERLLTRKQPAA